MQISREKMTEFFDFQPSYKNTKNFSKSQVFPGVLPEDPLSGRKSGFLGMSRRRQNAARQDLSGPAFQDSGLWLPRSTWLLNISEVVVVLEFKSVLTKPPS